MNEDMMFWSATNASARLKAAIAEATAESAKAKGIETARDVRDLASEIDRLELLLEAQWSLLREHLPVKDADLRNRARELDLSDGNLDGKLSKDPTVMCSACGRKVRRNAPRCTYCGDAM